MVPRQRGRGRVGHRRHPFDTAPLLCNGAVSSFQTLASPRAGAAPAVPIAHRLFGGASLANRTPMTLSRAAIVSASATAAAAAGVLLRREQLTRAATERFAAAAMETLLNATDATDAETGAHVRRVATYALILGEAADLTEHECK